MGREVFSLKKQFSLAFSVVVLISQAVYGMNQGGLPAAAFSRKKQAFPLFYRKTNVL